LTFSFYILNYTPTSFIHSLNSCTLPLLTPGGVNTLQHVLKAIETTINLSIMRKVILVLLAIAVGVAAIVIASTGNTAGATNQTPLLDSAALAARGDYLLNSGISCAPSKRVVPDTPEIMEDLRLSGFPRNGHLPPVDLSAFKQ
jgi:hypothetical protein